jgi:hypothetical protein
VAAVEVEGGAWPLPFYEKFSPTINPASISEGPIMDSVPTSIQPAVANGRFYERERNSFAAIKLEELMRSYLEAAAGTSIASPLAPLLLSR